MKHVGFDKRRLSRKADNPREVAFARQWVKENTRVGSTNILIALIPDATQRDATVAATIAQWLGSNCGMAFLGEVIHRSPEVRMYLLEEIARAEG